MSDYEDDFEDGDDAEEAREAAYEQGFEKGKDEGQSSAFGCGCLVGILLTFVVIYMGWCSPYPFGH